MLDKKKNILAALVAISVFVWMRSLGVFANNRRAGNPRGAAFTSPASAARQAARSEYKDYRRNPFTAAPVSRSQSAGLQLGGIMYDDKEVYCLINDQIVRVGDTVGARRVVSIEHDKVTLSDGVKETELKLDD